jgi:hypothetical protein
MQRSLYLSSPKGSSAISNRQGADRTSSSRHASQLYVAPVCAAYQEDLPIIAGRNFEARPNDLGPITIREHAQGSQLRLKDTGSAADTCEVWVRDLRLVSVDQPNVQLDILQVPNDAISAGRRAVTHTLYAHTFCKEHVLQMRQVECDMVRRIPVAFTKWTTRRMVTNSLRIPTSCTLEPSSRPSRALPISLRSKRTSSPYYSVSKSSRPLLGGLESTRQWVFTLE